LEKRGKTVLIPSIDLMGGRIVQLVQGEKLKLAFDDFDYWIERFSKYPVVQLAKIHASSRASASVCPARWAAACARRKMGDGCWTRERNG
jgi:phosphoribosylformimino-5-aminoimidazole carboxamide ribotide isomerase